MVKSKPVDKDGISNPTPGEVLRAAAELLYHAGTKVDWGDLEGSYDTVQESKKMVALSTDLLLKPDDEIRACARGAICRGNIIRDINEKSRKLPVFRPD